MSNVFPNLFPADLDQVAKQTFGPRYCKSVLLKLLDADYCHHLIVDSKAVLSLLNPKEISVANNYKLAKRRIEFITGRICAKMAIQNYQGLCSPPLSPAALREIEIAAGTDGRPFVRGQTPLGNPIPEISITHSRDFAGAIASQFHCGIDIQRSEMKLERVKEKYCTTAENQLLQNSLPNEEPLALLTILWSTKEAVKKTCSHHWMPGFLDMEIIQIDKSSANSPILTVTVNNPGTGYLDETYTVVTGMFSHYGIAICIGVEKNNAGTP